MCTTCGATTPKWVGKCSSCESWNTYQEEQVLPEGHQNLRSWHVNKQDRITNLPTPLAQIKAEANLRASTGDAELDRVLGGGIVPGSITLIGGYPGVGKSTLLLQLALSWPGTTLYVSGEESNQQIKLRAERLGTLHDRCMILSETNLENIIIATQKVDPTLVVVDSIQTVYSSMLDSSAGTVSQVRDCTTMLQRMAKETGIPVVIVGHITKEGALAGPKVLEHIVDTVLQFEGDRHFVFRLLRSVKNRFGSTEEIGIYEMSNRGLSAVTHPSRLLLTEGDVLSSGNTVGATLEGMRPFLIEVQALVSNAVYGTPQRSTTGFDLRRLHMLLAVLEKRCGLFFGQSDVFLNIAGGIKVTDPAIDLPVLVALISSLEDIAIQPRICFAGEIGLSGEIRSVSRLEQRILEAERLGFTRIFISSYHEKNMDFEPKKIQVIHLASINELHDHVFNH